LNTLTSEIKQDGIKNIARAIARAKAASASDRITRRMLKKNGRLSERRRRSLGRLSVSVR